MPMPIVTQDQAKKAFEQYDTSGDGLVSIQELREALEAFGLNSDQINTIFMDLDKSGDSKLNFDEFQGQVCCKHRDEGIEDLFKKIDKDNTGTITWAELESSLGPDSGCTDVDAVKNCFEKTDVDGSGTVDLCEFKAHMNGI